MVDALISFLGVIKPNSFAAFFIVCTLIPNINRSTKRCLKGSYAISPRQGGSRGDKPPTCLDKKSKRSLINLISTNDNIICPVPSLKSFMSVRPYYPGTFMLGEYRVNPSRHG